MKTHVLLVLMAFGCSPVMAEDRSAPWPLEIEGPAVYECLKTTEGEINPVTYWRVRGIGEKDADGNESLDLVKPPAKFELVEDLGEYEEEHVLAASRKKITVTFHDYEGICTFE
tara:strand:- start:720 stop:1061 length:342 start_codon:yes stop_codon:yes gene_type:complete